MCSQMRFRLGLNLGDVIVREDNIYGDGVNIAARIEGLADGGGICISGSVYDQVENKLVLTYEFLGEQQVKNIARPVRVYRVQAAALSATSSQHAASERQEQEWRRTTGSCLQHATRSAPFWWGVMQNWSSSIVSGPRRSTVRGSFLGGMYHG